MTKSDALMLLGLGISFYYGYKYIIQPGLRSSHNYSSGNIVAGVRG